MKNTLRKKNRNNKSIKVNIKKNRNSRKKNRNSRKKIGGFFSAQQIKDAYNSANKTYKAASDTYSKLNQNASQKYQDLKQQYDVAHAKLSTIYNDPQVQQHLNTLSSLSRQISSPSMNDAYSKLNQSVSQKYQDFKQQYDDTHAKLSTIYNDPQVQQHLNTLSALSTQMSSPTINNSEEEMKGGFFSSSSFPSSFPSSLPSSFPSSLSKGLQSANTSYTNQLNKINNQKKIISQVYNNPDVKKSLNDLSTHSYNTAKNGTLFGLNTATGAPISAAYRGYNTYSSAQKGINSAKNLYASANNAYKSTAKQANI